MKSYESLDPKILAKVDEFLKKDRFKLDNYQNVPNIYFEIYRRKPNHSLNTVNGILLALIAISFTTILSLSNLAYFPSNLVHDQINLITNIIIVLSLIFVFIIFTSIYILIRNSKTTERNWLRFELLFILSKENNNTNNTSEDTADKICSRQLLEFIESKIPNKILQEIEKSKSIDQTSKNQNKKSIESSNTNQTTI